MDPLSLSSKAMTDAAACATPRRPDGADRERRRRLAGMCGGMSSAVTRHSHLKRWGAAYLLLAFFLASWIGQFIFMLIEVGNEAQQHGQSFSMSECWPQFWSSTFENWQSEWLQLFVQAVI